MTFNEHAIRGKWLEIKADIQKTWGKLTDNELEQTKGDVMAIQGLLQQRYGEAQEVYGQKVSEIFSRFNAKKDAAVEVIKTKISTKGN